MAPGIRDSGELDRSALVIRAVKGSRRPQGILSIWGRPIDPSPVDPIRLCTGKNPAEIFCRVALYRSKEAFITLIGARSASVRSEIVLGLKESLVFRGPRPVDPTRPRIGENLQGFLIPGIRDSGDS